MDLPEAFYEPLDERRYRPTTATTSPWDDRLQHGGPPSALALHALGRAHPRPNMRVAQVVVNFLGVIPRSEMTADVTIERPGRRVELARIVLSARERPVVSAAVWRIAMRSDVAVPAAVLERERRTSIPPVPPPQEQVTFEGLTEWGYGCAIEWRFVAGGFNASGPAELWTRVRIPLVAGRDLDGVERVAVVADSANGVSKELDMRRFMFVPTSIAVTLDRGPSSYWTYMAASTHIGSEGLGFTACTLADERGVLGTASQALIVEPRGQGGAEPSA
jgi:hypothetical protein